MITINLLPTKKKAARKVTELQQQMILGMIIFLLVVGGMVAYWQNLSAKVSSLEAAKAAAEARIKEQNNMLKEVDKVEDQRKKVNDKIQVIEQLKKTGASWCTFSMSSAGRCRR